VVPAEDLDPEVERLAQKICDKSATAIGLGKGLFYQQQEMGIEAAYQLAAHTMACNMMDASALDGVQAFLDKKTSKAKQ
jgi:enoyl-CoA hydratase/carnithine racemase